MTVAAGAAILLLIAAARLQAADPTYLRRNMSDIQPKNDDLTMNAQSASYKPIFGIGDKDAKQLHSVVRCGEVPAGVNHAITKPSGEHRNLGNPGPPRPFTTEVSAVG